MSRQRKERRLQATLKAPKEVNVSAALGVKRVPDLSALDEYRRQAAQITLSAKPKDGPFLVSKTHEQLALESCAEWFKKLNADEPKFATVLASMIAFRRGYAVMYRELHELLAQAQNRYPDAKGFVPELVADFTVQVAMNVAGKTFNEHDVMQGMLHVVLPALTDILDAHTVADEEAQRKAQTDRNERRRARLIPIDLKHSPTQENTDLDRQRSVVLIGWRNALQWLFDKACANVTKPQEDGAFQVVRFSHKAAAQDQQTYMVRLGGTAWHGCTNSERTIDLMVHEFIAKQLTAPVDLVVCDDLPYAHTKGFVGRLASASAGDAQRLFRKWCDKMGAGFLGGIPLPTLELPDFSGQEYEQLKTFCTFRLVQVVDEGDHYRVIVGNHASVFDVPKYALDAYSTALPLSINMN